MNSTDKISKVSPHSVNSGIAGGISKISGKAEKDIVIALSELFPDLAYDTALDRAAKNFGFTTRLTAVAATTYVRVVGAPGTTYSPGTHTFPSNAGVVFNTQVETVIGAAGFAYVPVVAAATGARTNVDALTISQVAPQPAGHLYCINEYKASNGLDLEDDNAFRARIKDGGSLLAKTTLGTIQALAIIANPKVLRAYNYGTNKAGKRLIGVSTQNGEVLNNTELNQLKLAVNPYLALSDSQWHGTNYSGIEFINIQYQYVDISFRALLDDSINSDDIRRNIQLAVAKYLDFRTFDPITMKVEWDSLLEIVKSTSGVKYVPDQFFYPRIDIAVNTYKLPRLRGFMMLDMDGNIISNLTGTLSPVYYPNEVDFAYQAAVLQNL